MPARPGLAGQTFAQPSRCFGWMPAWPAAALLVGAPAWAQSAAPADAASAAPAIAAASAAAPDSHSAASWVAHALGWLDPLMWVLWLLVVALGIWRFTQLRQRAHAQAAVRKALGAAAPLADAPVPSARGPAIAALLCVLALIACTVSVFGGPGAAQWQALDEGTRLWSAAHMQAAPALCMTLLQWLSDSGDVLFMAVVTVLFAIWLARRKRWLDLQVWLFFSVANGLTIRVLKQLADRERPENLHQLVVSGASFPSGHAAGSLLVYALMAWLLTAHWHGARRQLVVGLAVLWALAIGVSRVLLAAHWASDVAAGWLLGATSVLLAVAVSRALRAD